MTILIQDSKSLADFCESLAKAEYVTVDTEFMREKTYYPQLCLVQLAGPDAAAAIDPLALGMDLKPLFALMANPAVLKVFHAARQDIEIFYFLGNVIPAPLFDTQVAAMVCGFGDSVGYETLASRLANARIDKSFRFSDWAGRPLSDKQLDYALADVTHLRIVYEKLAQMLEKNGRAHWLTEEMAVLTAASTYDADPMDSWRRLKPRTNSTKFLAVLREIAAWRELEARKRDLPRNRFLRDEALLEIAAREPKNADELGKIRALSKGFAEGAMGKQLLDAVKRGTEVPKEDRPQLPERVELPAGRGPIVELMKVLLKLRCEENGVAQKLVANTGDLEAIAADDKADVPALQGWRREMFGDDALDLKQGRLALTADGMTVKIVPVQGLAAQ
ncbi:ribonuclease D [Oceanibaculum pacificum]|uniref:Ribonuclease D n=1 Tax=Oceanibaculum pacificum TaxID=580166 RepID=A0A154W803_9PROT|nr:ribonuclease D [Oceanibaculum pacificum]KZD09664.1 ribonuclease D [Oceanibaculum pacificum]